MGADCLTGFSSAAGNFLAKELQIKFLHSLPIHFEQIQSASALNFSAQCTDITHIT